MILTLGPPNSKASSYILVSDLRPFPEIITWSFYTRPSSLPQLSRGPAPIGISVFLIHLFFGGDFSAVAQRAWGRNKGNQDLREASAALSALEIQQP